MEIAFVVTLDERLPFFGDRVLEVVKKVLFSEFSSFGQAKLREDFFGRIIISRVLAQKLDRVLDVCGSVLLGKRWFEFIKFWLDSGKLLCPIVRNHTSLIEPRHRLLCRNFKLRNLTSVDCHSKNFIIYTIKYFFTFFLRYEFDILNLNVTKGKKSETLFRPEISFS